MANIQQVRLNGIPTDVAFDPDTSISYSSNLLHTNAHVLMNGLDAAGNIFSTHLSFERCGPEHGDLPVLGADWLNACRLQAISKCFPWNAILSF